jgi:hypothetical protein
VTLDAAVQQLDDGPRPGDAPRVPRVSAVARRNVVGQTVLVVPCPHCGDHVQGARSLPAVFIGACGSPVIVVSAEWPGGEPFEIEGGMALMPNRKVDSGWYRLPKSNTPYYGPVPEGADRLDDAEVKKLATGAADKPAK